MTNTFPVISCVCVTRGKPAMLNRAIVCFMTQLYQPKELIVVYEEDDTATIAFLEANRATLSGTPVRFICAGVSPKLPLGELRNMGIRAASGEYICQWDDDDWYHTSRLQEQFRLMQAYGYEGSILAHWLVFDAVHKKAFVSNKRLWEGSILCKKTTLLLKPYEQKHIGEDTPTIDYLVALNRLHVIDNFPCLYIYVYHGNNTWGYHHWNYIFACSTVLPEKDTETIVAILDEQYSPFEASLLLDKIAAHYHNRKTAAIS